VQPAFEIAEENRDRLDPFFVGEVLDAFFLKLVRGNTLPALSTWISFKENMSSKPD
jgi:hypothetical protein